MKPGFVSVVAVLFCGAILAIVGLFGYSRYKAAEQENAAFGEQLQAPAQDTQSPLATRMPDQLPPRATSSAVTPTPTPVSKTQ